MEKMLFLILFSFNWTHYTNSGDIISFATRDSILYAGTNGGFLIINMERDSIVEKYTGSEGLLENEIIDLELSPFGGIWIGYKSKGLSYFKENNFYHYDFSQIASTYIFDILFYENYLIICDTNSLKVIDTKGTEKIEDDYIYFIRTPEWSNNDLIKYAAILRDTIFLASKNSVYYESFDKFIAGISPNTLIQNISINSIKVCGDSLFILTQNGFYIYPSLSPQMSWAKIYDITKTDSMYFLGTNVGVFYWTSQGSGKVFNTMEWNRVYVYKGKIFAGNRGRKDLNTGKGIFIYNDSLLYNVKGKIRELASNTISSLTSYKNGFACGFRSVGGYSSVSIVYYDGRIFDGFDNWTRGVARFDDKIIAARFGGGGMFILDSTASIIDTIFEPGQAFHTVKYVPEESLIIASRVDIGSIIFYSFKGQEIPPKTLQEYINDVEWDKGIIWVVTGPSTQIIKIDLGENIYDPVDDKVEIINPGISFCALDVEVDNYYIYIASTNGFYIYKKEPFGLYLDLTDILPDPFCLGVEVDKRKDLWVLTLKGLIKIKYGYKDYELFLPGPYSIMEITDPGENPQLSMGSEVLDIDEENSKIICGTLKGVAILNLREDYYKSTPFDSIIVYPNPCDKKKNKYIYIKTLSDLDEIMVFNLAGKRVDLKFEKINIGYRIRSKELEPGVYILRIKKSKNEKFLKFSVF
ncbi:MAG: T9SS type A sorting domain-containing protein [candidate division WOR-3 bacterium]